MSYLGLVQAYMHWALADCQLPFPPIPILLTLGILSVVMELHDFSSSQENRERNAKLVPVLLKKLKGLQSEGEEERAREREELFKRPFALFSKSPMKRRLSQGQDEHSSSIKHGAGDNPGSDEQNE